MLRYAQWKANFNHFAAVISDKIEHTIVSYIILRSFELWLPNTQGRDLFRILLMKIFDQYWPKHFTRRKQNWKTIFRFGGTKMPVYIWRYASSIELCRLPYQHLTSETFGCSATLNRKLQMWKTELHNGKAIRYFWEEVAECRWPKSLKVWSFIKPPILV